MRRNEVVGLLVAIALFAILLSTLILKKIVTTDRAIELIILFTLALATILYAKRTAEMADEMMKQRYTESLPLLVPTIPPGWDTRGLAPNEVPYGYLQIGIGIRVIWHNAGKGVAINSQFSFCCEPSSSGKAKFFPPRESGTLEVGGKEEVNYHEASDGQLRDISDAYRPHLLAEYQDIYEREITTVQEFRIKEQQGHKRAFIGKLYFIIAGKRLGEEVIQRD